MDNFYFDDYESSKERLERKIKKEKAIKKRNKSYLKGRRGVRLYYDIDKKDKEPYLQDDYVVYDKGTDTYRYSDYDKKENEEFEYDEKEEYEDYDESYSKDIDDFNNPNRQIKCIFKQKLRREKLFGYLKYLNGRKVLNRDIAWKYAVTKRTIQSDLRWLENNGFITTQKNKTNKGKQTKNSYIVHLEKQKDLPCDDTWLGVAILTKIKGEYHVLAKTNYKPKEDNLKKFIPIKQCNFKLPQAELKVESRLEHKSSLLIKKLFEKSLNDNYKGHVHTSRFIKVRKHRDDYYDLVIVRSNAKILYSLYILDDNEKAPNGYMWIKLKTANRYFCQTIDNKCLNKIKTMLG